MILQVVICTHNPRRDYLDRVLGALRNQTLPASEWRLLIVDNCSDPGVGSLVDLSWHPHGRIVVEPELGVAAARQRSFQESAGDLIIMVDDDTVIAGDYLAIAKDLHGRKPWIGAFGGQNRPEFEAPLPDELNCFYGCLALGDVPRELWANDVDSGGALPFGAGMCVRADVAKTYAAQLSTNALRKSLGRVGQGLGAGEDTDIALTAIDMGYGIGRFPALKLTHLIPKRRVVPEYLEKLLEDGEASMLLLRFLRGLPMRRYIPRRERVKFWLDFWAVSPGGRRFMLAKRRGEIRGLKMIAELERRSAQPSSEIT